MNGPPAEAWITAQSTYSATREAILEHRFLADLGSELWRRGAFDFTISHSEVDHSGYDLIAEAGGVTRHIQLKGLCKGGKRAHFDIQIRLGDKPSGCVIVLRHDPLDLSIENYLWFGNPPGMKLGSLGDRPARHAKGNAQGVKAERPALRRVPIASFTAVETIPSLTDLLFGIADDHASSAPA